MNGLRFQAARRHRRLFVALFAALLIAAEEPAPRELPANASITSKGIERADIYLFTGAAGSRQTIKVKGSGPLQISMLTPAGDIMNSAKGEGEVELETVLSSTDIHSVIVMRENGSKPYAVTRSMVEPTVAEMMLAFSTGYRFGDSISTDGSGCWIEPGRKHRYVAVAPGFHYVATSSMASDGSTYTTVTEMTDSGITEAVISYRIDGNVYIRTDTTTKGTTVNRLPLGPAPLRVASTVRWKSYLC
jgi:hypothetical protein